jgi:hypothetical protein
MKRIHILGYPLTLVSGLAAGATAAYLLLGKPAGDSSLVSDRAGRAKAVQDAGIALLDSGFHSQTIDASAEEVSLDNLFAGDDYCSTATVLETLERSRITDPRAQYDRVFSEAQGYYWAGREPHQETAGHEYAPLRAYCLFRLFESLQPTDSRRAVASFNAAQALLRFADREGISDAVKQRYFCGAVDALDGFVRLMERDRFGAFRPPSSRVIVRRFSVHDGLVDDAASGGELYGLARSRCGRSEE